MLKKPVEGQLAYALSSCVYATEAEAMKWATFLNGESGHAAAVNVMLVRVEVIHAALTPDNERITCDDKGRPIEAKPGYLQAQLPT